MPIEPTVRQGRSAPVRVAAAAALSAALLLAPGPGRAQPQPLQFGPPVRIPSGPARAWEPTLLIDRFGNVFVTARKDTTQVLLAPDDRSPTLTRSMSWVWVSTDGGKTFEDMHGLPLDLENHDWGYEGDLALDDAGHLYLADQNYADSTITRWTVRGLGEFSFDFHRPLLPTAQPIDDRPWLAAHGNGNVFYIAQAGAPQLNPFGRKGGPAYGLGRYSVYRSTNGAKSFGLFGHSLRQSGACRPAADHRPGSKLVYIVCTNDGGAQGLTATPSPVGAVWAYVSADNGATWARHRVGSYNGTADTFDWPLVTVGPNGDVWALHVDAGVVQSGVIMTNKLNLYHSTDQGHTWSLQDITPGPGRYRWGWLRVSPQGDLGLAIQHRPNAASPWKVYAAVFSPGSVPALVSVDDAHPVDGASSAEPPSELVGLDFAPDGTIGVAWTRIEIFAGLTFRRVYFARSIP